MATERRQTGKRGKQTAAISVEKPLAEKPQGRAGAMQEAGIKEVGKDLGLTRQRRVVLQVVRASADHLTANEVFEASRKLMPTISFATVYNSLRYLKDCDLISEITFGNGASRFDRETARHDHAVCTGCGKLVDFALPGIAELTESAARCSKFTPQSIHLTLVGICPACRAG